MIIENPDTEAALITPYIVILGTAQDGGYPQAGCNKECCKEAWKNPGLRKLVTSIAVIDPATKDRWLFDITPDFKEQLHILEDLSPSTHKNILSGIFLTHGHTGHYTGLIHLSREVMNANNVDVFAMPMMLKFLSCNNPWKQLILNKNIRLNSLSEDSTVPLTEDVSISPLEVPHRGELTKTVGYKIVGPNKTILFVPDIDYWNEKILSLIDQSDIAIVDGTFFNKDELPERNIDEIPHPLMVESMQVFKNLSAKNKIYFTHFNHTNPVLSPESVESKTVLENGFLIAQEKQIIRL